MFPLLHGLSESRPANEAGLKMKMLGLAGWVLDKCSSVADEMWKYVNFPEVLYLWTTAEEWFQFLKEQCHEDFAVLGQFCAKIIALRL